MAKSLTPGLSSGRRRAPEPFLAVIALAATALSWLLLLTPVGPWQKSLKTSLLTFFQPLFLESNAFRLGCFEHFLTGP
jgi:hypothetical protein